jgi:hypothetical protein
VDHALRLRAGLLDRVEQPEGAEEVRLEGVVHRRVEGHGRCAMDDDVGRSQAGHVVVR